jgi:hypothetical protein
MMLGKEGDKLTGALQRLGFVIAMPVIATITLLTGFWLYWRFTAGFNPEISRTHSAMSLGMGAVTGIAAYLIGALIIGRSVTRANALSAQAASAASGPERARLLSTAMALRRRAAVNGKVAAALLIMSVIFMSIANYI